jgi:tyrosyl-tRNA synthetase
VFPSLNEQIDLIKRGTSEIIPEEELVSKIEKSIRTDTPLKVKLGCDPSKPDLHLGHSVVLRKLRQFQDLGHQAILIVGDFTGMIGDPSGRSKTRPPLTLDETRRNGQSYFEQATKILSTHKIEMLYNSEWLGKMGFADVILLGSRYTVARMLERDDFERRHRAGEPISIHEFLYPLAQAMDSVAIKSDVELGGTDQKFNLLVGRDIQREYGMEPQVIITMPILRGTDGTEKMSKSLDNYIGVSESPQEMYGKTLSIPDTLILDYFVLATALPAGEPAALRSRIASAPRDMKRQLARELVTLYHGSEAADAAEREFDRLHVNKKDTDWSLQLPDAIPEVGVHAEGPTLDILELLVKAKMASSRSDARRLVEQGGITVDGRTVSDRNAAVNLERPVLLKVGKLRFARIIRA